MSNAAKTSRIMQCAADIICNEVCGGRAKIYAGSMSRVLHGSSRWFAWVRPLDPCKPELRSLRVGQLMAVVEQIIAVGKPICNGRAKIDTGAKGLCCSRETVA
jgi:hypothetical protein